MKDIKIKALGKKLIPDNFLVSILTTKAVKYINDYFDSEKSKGDTYLVSYSYYEDLINLSKIANLAIDYEENEYKAN